MPSMCSNQRAWNFINVNLSMYGMVVCLSVCSFLCDVFWKKKNLFTVNGTWPLSHFHNLLITLYCSLCKSSKTKGRRNFGVKGSNLIFWQNKMKLVMSLSWSFPSWAMLIRFWAKQREGILIFELKPSWIFFCTS